MLPSKGPGVTLRVGSLRDRSQGHHQKTRMSLVQVSLSESSRLSQETEVVMGKRKGSPRCAGATPCPSPHHSPFPRPSPGAQF